MTISNTMSMYYEPRDSIKSNVDRYKNDCSVLCHQSVYYNNSNECMMGGTIVRIDNTSSGFSAFKKAQSWFQHIHEK